MIVKTTSGKIIEVNENTSRVRLLTSQDQLSKVSVQIHTSKNDSIQGYLEQYNFKEINNLKIRITKFLDDFGTRIILPNSL